MSIAVACYSLQGGTYEAAKDIAAALGADLIRLEPKKPYPTGGFRMYFWCGKSATFREAPRLKPYAFEGEYDAVVVCTPVWAGTFTPPVRTFLRGQRGRIRRAALVACCGGGETKKCFAGMERAMPGVPILAKLRLVLPGDKDANGREIGGFCQSVRDALGAEKA